MDSLGLWQIVEKGPVRLQSAKLGLERHLEDWIERDPSLLERGLVIVGRQMRLEGGPLDLLALDPVGRWVLIEIKRTLLRREVIAQAVDYASCLHELDTTKLRDKCDAYLRAQGAPKMLDALLEERGRTLGGETDGREVIIYLVGTGSDQGLGRMAEFLGSQGKLAIKLVTFAVFHESQGTTLLSRSIHEGMDTPVRTGPRETAEIATVESALSLADQNGVGPVVRTLHAAALHLGFVPRPFAGSIMFAPPANRTRCLFVVWLARKQREPGVAKAFIAAEAFEQFYGISQDAFTSAVGDVEYVKLDAVKAEQLAAALRALMEKRQAADHLRVDGSPSGD